MSRPVILLVPGAWHGPSGFTTLIDSLSQHGYAVKAIPLASVGSEPPQPNFEADVQGIRSAVSEYVDGGSEIILLFHSYAGVPGSSACKGLLKRDREAAGKPGGIVHLIYCASFALDEGVSLMDTLGGEPLPWFNIAGDQTTLMPKNATEMFYNDIQSESLLEDLISKLMPQSYGPFWSKTTYAAHRDVNSTYVVCQRDNALPTQVQRDIVAHVKEKITATGGTVTMQEVEMDTSHSPFLSQPAVLADIIRGIAGEQV